MWRAAIGALMLAYCLPAAYVTIWPDTARDLLASLSLARGESIPLVGPGPINFGPYAGPAWIWLQAPPLVFFPSFVAASFYVALIASLKFPALYVLGRRISGPRLGACMAAAAAFPSAALYQWIVLFHPNWVEVTVTATLILLLIADQRRSLAMVYAGVVMLGLAVQMHTTTLFYLPLVAFVLYRLGVRGVRMAAHLAATVILIALWFAPVLFAPEAARGKLEDATTRIAGDVGGFAFETLLATIKTAYSGLPMAVGETYGVAAHVPAAAWNAGLVLLGIAVACGAAMAARAQPLRRPLLFSLAMLACAWIVIVAVRSYTSFYTVYFLLPASAIVMGLCLEAACGARTRIVRGLGHGAVCLLVLSLFVAAYGARSVGRSGEIHSRVLALGDLAHPSDTPVRGTYVTAAARDALAREACGVQGPITLHGELAHAISTSLRLDYVMHCRGALDRIRRLGNAPGTHFAMLPDRVATTLGIAQGKPIRGMRLLRSVRPIYPGDARPFDPGFSYFERVAPSERRPVQRVVLDFETGPGEVVVVHRHKPYATQWGPYRVTRDGAAVTPAHSTFNSWIYRADETARRWHVEFETDTPQWVEVIAMPR